MAEVDNRGLLSGLRVIDASLWQPGHTATQLLADLGADVLKVEPPGGDRMRRMPDRFTNYNGHKRSIVLDLKTADARSRFLELAHDADVIVENGRPGAVDRLGIGFDAVRLVNPAIVYCSISGYGQTGPRREEPGYDAVMQAEGGLMSITGPADGAPYRLGVAIVDIVSGMFAAQGILAALVSRGITGRGQVVDIGMLDAATALLTYQAGNFFANGVAPGRLGNRHPTIAPYETFATSDGDVALAVGNDSLWQAFCAAADLPGLGADPRFATNALRLAHYDELRATLVPVFASRPRAEWQAVLREAGVPNGAVRGLDEVFADPQTAAREMLVEVAHATLGPVKVTGVPVKLSATPGSVRTAPPTLGQHTAAVLAELGYDQAGIEALVANGAVRG